MFRFSAMTIMSISAAESCVVADLSASLIRFHVTFHTVHNGSESCCSGDALDKITFTSISSILCTLIREELTVLSQWLIISHTNKSILRYYGFYHIHW